MMKLVTSFCFLMLVFFSIYGCTMKEQYTNIAVYFEIPVKDMERAKTFYQQVFLVSFSDEVLDNHPMALFPFYDKSSGISGALAYGDSYEPGTSGVRIYFGVTDIDSTLKRASESGGTVFYPKKFVDGNGWVAEIIDSEGNIIALHQPD